MIRLRQVGKSLVRRRRVYEVEYVNPEGEVWRKRTPSPVFALEPHIGVFEAWAMIHAARALGGSSGIGLGGDGDLRLALTTCSPACRQGCVSHEKVGIAKHVRHVGSGRPRRGDWAMKRIGVLVPATVSVLLVPVEIDAAEFERVWQEAHV